MKKTALFFGIIFLLNGNFFVSAQCVGDQQLPVIIPPANITVQAAAGICGAVVNFTAPVGTDNCAVITDQVQGLVSGSLFPVGITTQEYMATDASGNYASATFTITVTDTQLPVIQVPANVQTCDPFVTGIAPVSFSDNCGVSSVTYTLSGATSGSGYTDASGTAFQVGTTLVTYLVTDLNANTNSASFQVVILPTYSTTVNASVCEGDSMFLAGVFRSTAGIYTDVYTAASGCDSLITTNFTLNSLPVVLIDPFDNNTTCNESALLPLPLASPGGGTYSGRGVSGNHFNPFIAGEGNHYVKYTVTNASGCQSSDSTLITVNNCEGISETKNIRVNAYPNPSNGKVFVNLGAVSKEVNVRVTEPNGKLVQEFNGTDTDTLVTDLSGSPAGLYFIQVQTGKENTVLLITKN